MKVELRQRLGGLLTAIVAVLVAACVRVYVLRELGDQHPFTAFYPAIILTALYGGMAAGLLATALSTLLCLYWIHTPHHLHLPSGDELRSLSLFVAVSLMMVWFGFRARQARRSAARALVDQERSEHRIGEMLDSLNEAFVLLDRDWRFVYVNRACAEMYGTTRERLIGRTLWEQFPHTVGTETERQYRRAMNERVAVEFETLSPRLGYWAASGAFPVAEGISIYVQNIDARKRFEQALRDSEERYRQFVEAAQEGVWMLDPESRTSYVNGAMAGMLGWTLEEMLRRPVYDFIEESLHEEARASCERRHQGIAERFDFRFRRKDGTVFFAHVSATPLRRSNGEYRGSLAMVSDITQRREAEIERGELLVREQKARAEAEAANRRKDHFLAVLSHELRTPLTPVLGRLSLMKRDPQLSDESRRGLEMIRRNVELEARLIDDLLDMTRLARGQLTLRLETIDAHAKILAALEIYDAEIATRKQSVMIHLDAREHLVSADAVRLQQIFWNLIGNAVKYTPPGGHLTVRSSNEMVGDTMMLRVEFIDDGIGIPPDVMPRLFDPFEQGEQTLTRRFGGLGLGLSISRTLAKMQGGTLTARSEGKGTGSIFTVELPVVSFPADAPRPAANQTPMLPADFEVAPITPADGSRRILLVDDNEDTLKIIARMLRLSGYEVKTADSVASAITAAADPFDLLITDIGLPDGTGWELMKTLCARGRVRGIALSGFSMDEDLRRSRDAGFIEHLSKPITPEDLEKAIHRAAAQG